VGKIGGVRIQHRDAGIGSEMMPEVIGQLGVQLEQQQPRFGMYPADDLPGMAAFSGAELGDDPRNGEVEFAGDAIDEDLGTRDDGSDLHGALKESLEE